MSDRNNELMRKIIFYCKNDLSYEACINERKRYRSSKAKEIYLACLNKYIFFIA